MPQVQLVLDLVTPESTRRAERSVALPGVPSVGEYIDTVPGPTLALHVTAVRWHAIEGTVMLFLGAGDRDRPGITGHGEDGVELSDYFMKDLAEAGWSIEDL